MKFKKVEIQGFRAYGDKEDATFDFSVKDDIADLISIYAPNGFGKTSFYDAVEWTITHKIKRFERALENYDLIKTEKNANKQGSEQSPALHIISKIGYEDLVTHVKIETTEKPFEKKIEIDNRKGRVDYDRKAELKNPNFRDVILSQEGINSFLVAEKPEDRYKNFVQHFDSQDLDRIYNNIRALRKENEKRAKVLTKDKSEVDRQLKKKIDKEVVAKINKLISDLITLKISIDSISQEFDLSDLAIFKSNIIYLRNEIELGSSSILEKLKKRQSILTKAQKDLPEYTKNIDKKKELIKLTERISKLIKDFDELKKKINRREKLNETLKKINKEKDDFNFMKSKLHEFKILLKELEQLEISEKKKNTYLSKLDNIVALINLNSNTFKDRKQSASIKIFEHEKTITNYKSSIKKSDNSRKKRSELELEVKSKRDTLKKENILLTKLKKEIEELLLAEKNFRSGIYDKNNIVKVNENTLAKLIDQKKIISNKTKEIELAKKALNDSISLKENLGYLIELGKKIVNNNKHSSCPLCKNEYRDHKELLERINSNNSLQDYSKEKTKKLTHLELELTNLIRENEKEGSSLNTIISEKIKELQLKINESTNKVETLSKELSLLEQDLEKHKIIIEKHEKENQKIDLENIVNLIKTLNNKVKNYNAIVEKYTLWTDRINEKKSNINREIYELDKQSEAIKTTNIYSDFNKILNVYNLDSNDPKIDDKLNKLKNKIEGFKKELSILNREITLLEESLKEYRKEELKEQLSIHQTDLLRISSFISEFDDLILNLNIKREELESSLKSKIDINEAEISKNESILRVLSKIEGMTESLGEYLNYNKLKQKETDLKLKIELNKRIDGDLQVDLQSISKKISSMIKKFFFDDLINTIYNKIDPHPQYKKINFKVDFDDYGSPKLNIFTEDNEKSGNRIPNLYFSTAQMNVLSLSIFLAKALHAVDEEENSIDTIFIDDPVQSMDSINVLSVIDLLRNIIINHNKQIIISTHDENFFNLLKKKIPSAYFKSKFLELETFGKLKKESNYRNLAKGIMDSAKNIIKKDMNDNDEMLMA